jgi:tetratricopeptide (TPR) repeat protein
MEDHEMYSLPTRRQLGLGVLLAVMAAAGSVVPAAAQGSRMRVLVPAFEVDNPRSRLGVQLAEQLRRQINQMPTHAPADARQVRNALRRFDLREEQTSCAQWLQLAEHVEAGLVLCGTVEESSQRVTARFLTPGGDAFEVPPFTMQSVEQAALRVVEAFGTYTRQLSLLMYCGEYLQSMSWEQALDNCSQAVELNPLSVSAHYARGTALANLNRLEEALSAFDTVLELDPLNQDALLHAGILAARLDRQDVSQGYFHRYLELNPGNEQVRLKVATDLANAGDPAGALKLVEEALADPESTGVLWEYAGHFAMNAGIKMTDAAPAGGAPDEANRFYRQAIRYYGEAVTKRGDSIDVAVYRNLMQAHNRIGDTERALHYGREATTRAPDDAQAWMVYADVLSGANRINEALRAFDRAAEADPDLPAISARRTVLLIEVGRLSEALAAARTGIQKREIPPDMIEGISQKMTQTGFQHAQQGRYEQALPYFNAAREIGRSDVSIAMANFVHGYSLVRQGDAIVKSRNNAASAREARPYFERAKVLLEGAGAYTAQAATRAQLLQQVNQLMEYADALIKAGR